MAKITREYSNFFVHYESQYLSCPTAHGAVTIFALDYPPTCLRFLVQYRTEETKIYSDLKLKISCLHTVAAYQLWEEES
jgi:hypothetical protein